MKFGGGFFQTKLLSRLSHRVCRRLSSPVLLRKFTSRSVGTGRREPWQRGWVTPCSTRSIYASGSTKSYDAHSKGPLTAKCAKEVVDPDIENSYWTSYSSFLFSFFMCSEYSLCTPSSCCIKVFRETKCLSSCCGSDCCYNSMGRRWGFCFFWNYLFRNTNG